MSRFVTTLIDDIVDTNASVIRNTREREEERKEDDNKKQKHKKRT